MPLHHANHSIVSIGLLVSKPAPFAINAGIQPLKIRCTQNFLLLVYSPDLLPNFELHPHPNVLDAEEVVAVLDLRSVGKGPLLEEKCYGLGPHHGSGNTQGVLIEIGKKVAKYRSFQYETYKIYCLVFHCFSIVQDLTYPFRMSTN